MSTSPQKQVSTCWNANKCSSSEIQLIYLGLILLVKVQELGEMLMRLLYSTNRQLTDGHVTALHKVG